MSELKVRKIDFQFSDDMQFQAFPKTPNWGCFVNVITLIAPAFERYFIKSIRQATAKIDDQALKKNAESFCAQEAQHSKHHLAHMKVLTHHYPGLGETQKAISDSYQNLYETESEEYHLAYAATVELTFGPIAQFVINNRQRLFDGGDDRIASFILWHLVEEFEHRNAAIDVYNRVVGNYLYRLKTAPKVFKHIFDVYQLCLEGIKGHAYSEDPSKMPVPHRAFDRVPMKSRLNFFYHLFFSLLPYHNPDSLRQPGWVTQWFADEDAGADMRTYYKT